MVIRPWRIVSVVRLRKRALRWSAGLDSFLKRLPWEIIEMEVDLDFCGLCTRLLSVGVAMNA